MSMANYDELRKMASLSAPLGDTEIGIPGPFLVQLRDVEFVGSSLTIDSNGAARFFDNGRGIYIPLPDEVKVTANANKENASLSFGDTVYELRPITAQWLNENSDFADDAFESDADARDFVYQMLIDPQAGDRYFVTSEGDTILGLYRTQKNKVSVRENGGWVDLGVSSFELENAGNTDYVLKNAISVYDRLEHAEQIVFADFEGYRYE